MNGAASGLELRDIHAAPPPDFWPPAPGWWVVAVIASIALIVLGRLLYRRYRGWRRRRIALRALADVREQFEKSGSATRLAAGLSLLLRRVALSRFPRDRVAGLSGARWLEFLDETGGKGQFLQGPGRILTTAPYAAHTDFDTDGVYALVRQWVKKNA